VSLTRIRIKEGVINMPEYNHVSCFRHANALHDSRGLTRQPAW